MALTAILRCAPRIWLPVLAATGAMAGALAWGVAAGDLGREGAALLSMPWGVVSLVEIYVGMTLFGLWVFGREASPARAGAWMLAVALAGNIAACAYVLRALHGSRGNAIAFWMGSAAPGDPRP